MWLLFLAACAPPPPPPKTSQAGSGGILVISLDTLRADRLGSHPKNLTPNLDRFAQQSIVFENAYAQANETLYSHAALFTGRHPRHLAPLNNHFRIPDAVPTLAGHFAEAGWDTAAFVAGGHLSKIFGLNRGFSVYDDRANWGSLQKTSAAALQWFSRRDRSRPFFAVVHGYDTHDRYLKPAPFGYAFADPDAEGLGAELVRQVGGASQVVGGFFEPSVDVLEQFATDESRFDRGAKIRERDPNAKELTTEDRAQLAAAYDGAVAWMDACFGLFLGGLEQQGLLENTIVVVLSDHGEELGENGVFHHRYSLEDVTTHVPLMIHLPGVPGRRVAGLVQLIDVAPTLWDLAKLRGNPPTDGHSLLSVLNGAEETGTPMVFSEGALRMTSVRSAHSRLLWEGFSAQNPLLGGALAVAPLDGGALRLSGDPAEENELRTALLHFIEVP